MKKRFLLLVTVLFLGFAVPVSATLWDRGGGLIYDDDLNITWLQEPNNTTMTWYQAMDWADNLSFYDSVRNVTWSDWRLPSSLNQDGSGPDWMYNVTGSEMGHLYYTELNNIAYGPSLVNKGPFSNLQSYVYWSSTEDLIHPYTEPVPHIDSFYFHFNDGLQNPNYKGYPSYALAVRNGDVGAPVPEPTTMLLLGSGLLGLVGLRRKFKK